MQVQRACILAKSFDGCLTDVLPLELGQDDKSDFGTQMNGIEVGQVGQPYGNASLLNNKSHLSVGIDVVLCRGNVLAQGVAGVGDSACPEVPEGRVVFNAIDQFQIFWLQGSQAYVSR